MNICKRYLYDLEIFLTNLKIRIILIYVLVHLILTLFKGINKTNLK
jgi:hypothetical protein